MNPQQDLMCLVLQWGCVLHRHPPSCAHRHLQPSGAEPQCGQESWLQNSSRFLPMLSSKLYYGTISWRCLLGWKCHPFNCWRGHSLGFTWRGHTVLVCGLQFIDGEQHHLDGSNEDASQAAIKYHVEQKDLNCGENRQTWGWCRHTPRIKDCPSQRWPELFPVPLHLFL